MNYIFILVNLFYFLISDSAKKKVVVFENYCNNDIKLFVLNKYNDYEIINILKGKKYVIEKDENLIVSTYSKFQAFYNLKYNIDTIVIKNKLFFYQNKWVEDYTFIDKSNYFQKDFEIIEDYSHNVTYNYTDLLLKALNLGNKKSDIFLKIANENLIQKIDILKKRFNNNEINLNSYKSNLNLIYSNYFFSILFGYPSKIKDKKNNFYYLNFCDSIFILALNNNFNFINNFTKSKFMYKFFFEKKNRQIDSIYNTINKLNINDTLKNYLYFYLIKNELKINRNSNKIFILNFLNKNNLDTQYTNYIKNLLNSYNDKNLYINKTVLTSYNNDTINLYSLLNNRNNKLKLIDFWASWCGPCREEMPSAKKIINKYQKKLDYIYISIDENVNQWYNAVKTEHLQDYPNNYIFYNFEKSEIYKNFKIESIPRFLLFGKDGKLISADAPRPSDPKLIELIEKNL